MYPVLVGGGWGSSNVGLDCIFEVVESYKGLSKVRAAPSSLCDVRFLMTIKTTALKITMRTTTMAITTTVVVVLAAATALALFSSVPLFLNVDGDKVGDDVGNSVGDSVGDSVGA